MKKNNKGIITKIVDIRIHRSYGFNDGGSITVGHFYKNHKPVQGVEDIVFYERGTIVERYAKECGINREDELNKLIGMEVATFFEMEDGYDGCLYDFEYLTRPFKISKKLNLNKFEGIVSVCRGAYEDEIDMEDAI